MMERREQRVGLGVGAFLNPPRADYSEDTRKLIRVLMEESKLSMIQRKSIEKAMDRGESLPPLSRAASAKAINTTRIIPSAYWKRRSQESILNSGAYEREQYRRTTPLPNKEKQKRDLACMMAYGKNMPETPRGPKILHKKSIKPDILQNDDIINDCVRERIEFLKEMEHLGLGKKYQPIIYQEIAEKIRIIDSMDSKTSFQIRNEIGEFKYEKPLPKPLPFGELDGVLTIQKVFGAAEMRKAVEYDELRNDVKSVFKMAKLSKL